MQRKIQEAEDAKKRLAALKIRAAKRTAAGAGAGKLPSGSMSSLSGSVSRTGSTPIVAITASAAANDGSSSAKGTNPLAADSDSGTVQQPSARDGAAESSGAAGVTTSHTSSPYFIILCFQCQLLSSMVRLFPGVHIQRDSIQSKTQSVVGPVQHLQ